MNLFAYGTLMDDGIMKRVSGCSPDQVPAALAGYRRVRVRGEVYPALVDASECCVDGMLYLDLPDSAWLLLDRFEGEMYQRIPVMVDDGNEGAREAEAYLWKPEYRHLLAESEWSFEEFLEVGRKRFKEGYQGFEDIKQDV